MRFIFLHLLLSHSKYRERRTFTCTSVFITSSIQPFECWFFGQLRNLYLYLGKDRIASSWSLLPQVFEYLYMSHMCRSCTLQSCPSYLFVMMIEQLGSLCIQPDKLLVMRSLCYSNNQCEQFPITQLIPYLLKTCILVHICIIVY